MDKSLMLPALALAALASVGCGQQLRGSNESPAAAGFVGGGAAVAGNASAADGVLPAWCEYVPRESRGVVCRGSASGCSCRGFCRDVPQVSWQWNPECCACGERPPSGGQDPNASRPAWCDELPERRLARLPACGGSPSAPDGGDGPVPPWCQYVPREYRRGPCRGSSLNSSSPGWCDNVPEDRRARLPACTSPAHRPEGGVQPAWCEYIPREYQGVACRGSAQGCSCREFCLDTPEVSWQWNPECCGCNRTSRGPRPPRGIPRAPRGPRNATGPAWCADVPEDRRERLPICAEPENRTANRTVPAWCENVPREYQGVACRGSAEGCGCRDFCEDTPRISHQWNPECCACGGEARGPAAPGGAPAVPAWCADVPEGRRARVPACSGRGDGTGDGSAPAWCEYVPPEYNGVACQGSARGCSCRAFCDYSPRVSWLYNPVCCGCEGAAPGGATPGDDDGQRPAWCDDVPQGPRARLPACAAPRSGGGGGGGAVPAWCRYIPRDFRGGPCAGP